MVFRNVYVCILELYTNTSHTDECSVAVIMCTHTHRHTQTLMASTSYHYHAI